MRPGILNKSSRFWRPLHSEVSPKVGAMPLLLVSIQISAVLCTAVVAKYVKVSEVPAIMNNSVSIGDNNTV